MRPWSFANPTPTRVGMQALSEIVGPADRVCVVTGRHAAVAGGWLDILKHHIRAADVVHLPLVPPEPTESSVLDLVEAMRVARPSVVIALGGGSVIDSTKIGSSIFTHDVDLAKIMGREVSVPDREVRLVAIPTTSGSGSEVTPFAVLTSATGIKRSLPSPIFFPDLAVLEPDFLTSLPRKVIADGGMDALAHSLEAIWSNKTNPISQAIGLSAAANILSHLQAFYDDPNSTENAVAMMTASNMAGYAFSNTFTTACHALSFPLSTLYKLTHGAACAVTLDRVMNVNSRDADVAEMLSPLAKHLELNVGEIPNRVRQLRDYVCAGSRPEALGISSTDRAFVKKNVFQPLLANNPVMLTDTDLDEILASGTLLL